jgi:hypothetical protein
MMLKKEAKNGGGNGRGAQEVNVKAKVTAVGGYGSWWS